MISNNIYLRFDTFDDEKSVLNFIKCKSQYKNVGLGQYKNVGFKLVQKSRTEC